MGKEFVHYHNHSEYSALDGVSKVKEMAARAKELGHRAIGLTDHGNMCGLLAFNAACREQEIKPLLGIEFYTTPMGHSRTERVAYSREKASRPDEQHRNNYHLIALAMDTEGFHNLCRLTTASFADGYYYKPRIDFELLQRHSSGLLITSACLAGEVNHWLKLGNYEKAREVAAAYKDVFGENYYLETMYSDVHEQKLIIPEIARLGKELGIKVTQANDAHYVRAEDAETQNYWLLLAQNRQVGDPTAMQMGPEYYLKDYDQMLRAVGDPEALANTLEIAEKCNVELGGKEYKIPVYDVATDARFEGYCTERLPELGTTSKPACELTTEDIDHRDYLHWMCMETYERLVLPGIADDPAKQKEYMDRLDFELDVVAKMGFIDYFLIVQDYVNYARDHGMPTGPGRGSAAGSLVSYLAGITRVDPIPFRLYFERFLNPDRIGMPDIDVDFPQSKRQDIMEYVRDRYTSARAAQVMTFGYERPKGSIKDMARVLGYPPMLADRITKTISDDLKATIDSELALGGDFTKMYNTDPDVKRIVDVAKKVEGLVRGDSIHASAFVIAPHDIADHMPMQTPKGQQGTLSAEDTASFLVQYDGTTVESLGYLKMDFLGLGNLDAISNTQRLIKKVHGIDIDLEDVPFDDKKTLALLRRAETAGLFQVESEGMKKTLKQVAPTRFSEISDIIALYRPGPMEYIPIYVEGKQNPDSIQYLDPRLKPILEDTYGVACIAEGSMVATEGGQKPIEAVEPGEMVLTEDGTYQRCLARWDNGVKETVVVRTDFGEELVCTPDHKVLTQLGWVPAGELTRSHLVKAFNHTGGTRVPEPFDWNDWLVGLFLADGYSSKTGSPSIACCSEEFANKVKGVVETQFPAMTGVTVYSSSNGLGTTWYVRLSQRSGHNGRFRKDHVPNEFNVLLDKYALKHASREGKIWPSDYSISTIIGFLEGDGCYINRRVNLKYEHLARSLYDALLSYGIRASLFRRDESAWSVAFDYSEVIAPRIRTYDGRNPRGYYLPKEYLLPFQENMPPAIRSGLLSGTGTHAPYVSGEKARRYGWSEATGQHALWGRVLSVKSGDAIRVYDLSIDKNHSIAIGGLIVKNCYQEQLMEIAKQLAGFTMAEADTLRKAIGKKKADLMASLKGKFVEGCGKNDISGASAESLWALMEAAGNYSFNKSHSVAYAFLAWYTAYFKANYPAEFMCSMMSYRKDHPKAAEFLDAFFKDCHRYGVAVLPPHVNRSGIDFDVAQPMEISFGLAALKGIGEGPAGYIVAEREKNGPYRDLNDFLSRMDPKAVNSGVIGKLATSGALDGLGWTRQALVEELETIKDFIKTMKGGDKHSEAQGTFDFFDEIEMATIEPTVRSEYQPDKLLEMEKENLGFYLSGNPLEYYELGRRLKDRHLPKAKLYNVSDLHALDDRDEVYTFGMITRLKRHQTQKGDYMAFVTLTDFGKAQESVHGYSPESYDFDTVVFPKAYQAWGHSLREGDFLLVHGSIKENVERGSKSLAADEVSRVDKDTTLDFDDPTMGPVIADARSRMEEEYARWSKPAEEGSCRLEISMPAEHAAEFLAVVDRFAGGTPAILVVDGRRKDLGGIDNNKRFRKLLEFLDAKVRMLDAE